MTGCSDAQQKENDGLAMAPNPLVRPISPATGGAHHKEDSHGLMGSLSPVTPSSLSSQILGHSQYRSPFGEQLTNLQSGRTGAQSMAQSGFDSLGPLHVSEASPNANASTYEGGDLGTPSGKRSHLSRSGAGQDLNSSTYMDSPTRLFSKLNSDFQTYEELLHQVEVDSPGTGQSQDNLMEALRQFIA